MRLLRWVQKLTHSATSLSMTNLEADADQWWSNILHLVEEKRIPYILEILPRATRRIWTFSAFSLNGTMLSKYSKSTNILRGKRLIPEHLDEENTISRRTPMTKANKKDCQLGCWDWTATLLFWGVNLSRSNVFAHLRSPTAFSTSLRVRELASSWQGIERNWKVAGGQMNSSLLDWD